MSFDGIRRQSSAFYTRIFNKPRAMSDSWSPRTLMISSAYAMKAKF